MNKDSYHSKGERGDLIIKMDDKYILVEMDMNNEIFRNVDYSDRVYRINTTSGKEYIYPEILLICFENFSYKGIEEDIMTFRMQTKRGICLIPRTYLLVFLPKLLKTWYYKNTNPELRGFYKTILTMYETSRKKALEYAKGDAIMEKYLEESGKIQNANEGLLRAYDHEQSLIEGMFKQGVEEGKKETRIESAKSLIKDGFDREKIIKSLNLTEEEIEELE